MRGTMQPTYGTNAATCAWRRWFAPADDLYSAGPAVGGPPRGDHPGCPVRRRDRGAHASDVRRGGPPAAGRRARRCDRGTPPTAGTCVGAMSWASGTPVAAAVM